MASSVVVANGNLNPNDTRGKTITCKAAVAYGPGEPFVVERILVHPPQKMEVRIKILFTTICHTDLTAWQGENEARRAYPRIFGHEASGIVESVGEGVSDMNEGDLVVPIFNGECGDCKYCKCEKTNKCERFGVDAMKKVMVSDGATRFYTMDGKPIFHFLNTSTFTEYTVVDSACIVKIHIDGSNGDLNRNIKRLTLLSCGVSSGVGAAWNTADVHFGSTVAVFGLGVVGLAIIGEMTGGGVHYSFECAGNLNVLRDAFLSAHEGWGLTVLVGIHLSPKMLPIHPMELFHGRRIVGSNFGGIKGKTQLPHFAKECMNGVVKLDDFITHELPFKVINQAFDLLTTGKSLRCLLHF
ncbi:Alcohol dehydrogenase-like 3 [Glycine soja]